MTVVVHETPHGPIRIHFEGLGTIILPSIETLAFVAGAGIIAATGFIEWPVAVLFALARLLTSAAGSGLLRGLGDALTLVR